jgi:small subunit ribosomal protein S6
MRYYETLYLINPNLSDEDYQDTLTKFSDLVDKNNGVVVKVDEWGKKSLAYQVKKFDKGFYVLLLYCGGPGITKELERAMRLDERVIKFQTVKLSDNADPEALKSEQEESGEKASPEATSSPDEHNKSEENQEGSNGLQ